MADSCSLQCSFQFLLNQFLRIASQGLRQFSSGSTRTRKPLVAKLDLSYKGDVSTRRQETPYTGDKKEEEEDVFVRRTQKPMSRRKESPFPNFKIKDWMKDGIDVSRIPMEHRDIHPNSVYSKMAGSARTLVSQKNKIQNTQFY